MIFEKLVLNEKYNAVVKFGGFTFRHFEKISRTPIYVPSSKKVVWKIRYNLSEKLLENLRIMFNSINSPFLNDALGLNKRIGFLVYHGEKLDLAGLTSTEQKANAIDVKRREMLKSDKCKEILEQAAAKKIEELNEKISIVIDQHNSDVLGLIQFKFNNGFFNSDIDNKIDCEKEFKTLNSLNADIAFKLRKRAVIKEKINNKRIEFFKTNILKNFEKVSAFTDPMDLKLQ